MYRPEDVFNVTTSSGAATGTNRDGAPPRRDSSATELTEEEILRTRARATAIPIPDEYSSDEDELGPSLYAASPGASSTVQRAESWRPMPPSMLGSSFDSRLVPSLKPRENGSPTTANYGAAAVAAAADVLRSEQASESGGAVSGAGGTKSLEMRPQHGKGRSASWRTKLIRATVQMRALSHAPRELWLVYSLKLLSSYSYFSLSLILTVFLTDEFGLSDYAAGWAYGTYGVMSTFFGVVCGWFIDYLGVRLALLLGACVGAFSRLVVTFTQSRHVALVMLYTLLPFAECLGIPIMTIAIKRYTNARNRTFAFSLFYSMMNVAALIAGPAVDLSRQLFRSGATLDFRYIGIDRVVTLTGLRVVVLSSSISTALMCVVVLFGIREVEVDESGDVRSFEPNRSSPMQQTLAVLREAAFWRLTVFTFLLVGVRLVFRHLDATMPKYLVRQFGPHAPYGLIYAINPFLIIFLVPLIGLATRGVSSFKMILYGSVNAAVSPFWICLAPTYFMVVMFMVTLSLGEAIYSPRVYEYTMEVSGRGNEGLYSSLSSAPLFSVKLLVGGMSGWLLTKFMSADGPHHGGSMWAIIGASSITSPILMYFLRDFISPSDSSGTPYSKVHSMMKKRSSRGSMPPTPREGTPLVSGKPPLRPSGAKPPLWKSTVPVLIDDQDVNCDEEFVGSMPHSAQSPCSMPRQGGMLGQTGNAQRTTTRWQ